MSESPERAEAAQTARHYGAMRFTMFTVFTTISGALLAAPFTAGGAAFAHAGPRNLLVLCVAGGLTSLLFGLLEWRVSQLLAHYQRRAHELGALPLPPGHGVWRWVALAAMLLPSLVTGAFWWLLWRGWLVLPPSAA
ncbi:hypothetical protein [Derxia gummosa]|uniref:Uncharacterized protein n=1 Tax=Derxia gummosa DSM 723 TaxID=1121388 RepID=A0A8B6X4C7_9BURK|nr:hypothetical protein [Derxia gummosa]